MLTVSVALCLEMVLEKDTRINCVRTYIRKINVETLFNKIIRDRMYVETARIRCDSPIPSCAREKNIPLPFLYLA